MNGIWRAVKSVFGGNVQFSNFEGNVAKGRIVTGVFTVMCMAVAALAVLALVGICLFLGGFVSSAVGIFIFGALVCGAVVFGIAIYVGSVTGGWEVGNSISDCERQRKS
jgi:hypothetical protein